MVLRNPDIRIGRNKWFCEILTSGSGKHGSDHMAQLTRGTHFGLRCHHCKNYLNEKESKRLERTVTSFFDYIENQIEQETAITMQAMVEHVDRFLQFNRFEVLQGKDRISRLEVEEKALAEYVEFN